MGHVWLWPNGSTTQPRVNSPWDMKRLHPVYHVKMPHYGTDFYIPEGVNRSVTDGVVERVGVVTGWTGGGYGVWVRNWDGSLAKYFHGVTGSAYVRDGDAVKAGDRLSRTGMTGAATGVHLHLEISPRGGANGQADPVPFLKARVGATASGGGGTVFEPKPDPPASPKIRKDRDDMAKLFYRTQDDKRTGPAAEWALAGSGDGEAAWLPIGDQQLANALAADSQSGRAIWLSHGTWDLWKSKYLGS